MARICYELEDGIKICLPIWVSEDPQWEPWGEFIQVGNDVINSITIQEMALLRTSIGS